LVSGRVGTKLPRNLSVELLLYGVQFSGSPKLNPCEADFLVLLLSNVLGLPEFGNKYISDLPIELSLY